MSITVRALLALVLLFGFYVLALGIAAGLLYIPYAEVVYAHRLHAKLAIGCILGAGAILLAIVPRPDRFQMPGPELEPESQPRLFAELEEIAAAVGERMPREVYLVAEVNAYVHQRGGIMGIGSHRVMGLGLPLLQAVTRSQLRAILAHEFGHYKGGDTMLGPWIYKTREAIGRTLQSLDESALQIPFQLYGTLFLRVSHAVSRHQELAADRLAASSFGAKVQEGALLNVNGAAIAFPRYMATEFLPLVQAGFRPPFAEGFGRFLGTPAIHDILSRAVTEIYETRETSIYDTHPALGDRIDALQELPGGDAPADDPPAITLLDGVAELEDVLVTMHTSAEKGDSLRMIAWDDVPEQFLVPLWSRTVSESGFAAGQATIAQLPALVAKAKAKATATASGSSAPEDPVGDALAPLAMSFALALRSQGFAMRAEPGEPVTLVRGDDRIDPFQVVQELGDGKRAADAWAAECARLGLDGSRPKEAEPAG